MLLSAEGTVHHEIEPIGTVSALVNRPQQAEGFLDFFSTWLELPKYAPQPVPELTRIVKRLIERTGWSNRGLAEIVGTTHPTIQSIKRGHEPERRRDLAEALFKTAEVVEKISRLAGGNQSVLRAVLSARGPGSYTPLQLLSSGEYAKAYLRALDMLNTSRPTVTLLDARQVRQPSQDVGLIFDDSGE